MQNLLRAAARAIEIGAQPLTRSRLNKSTSRQAKRLTSSVESELIIADLNLALLVIRAVVQSSRLEDESK